MPSLVFLLNYIKRFTNRIWIVNICTCNWSRKWKGLDGNAQNLLLVFLHSNRSLLLSRSQENLPETKPITKEWQNSMVPLCGNNSLVSVSTGPPASKHLPSSIWGLTPLRVSSSATKEVVTLTSGNIAILDTWLKRAIETPTAASSTGPARTNSCTRHSNTCW